MGKGAAGTPILIIGAYGRGNIGDDVFISCAVELFSNRKIYINSANNNLLPANVKRKVYTLSTTNSFDLPQKIATFLRMKEVTYWGGDFWVELHGARFPRQLLYKMILLNFLFRIFGKRVNYIGCGIGQLKGYSLFLARVSARLANTIAVREKRSAKILGISADNILPDIAVNLKENRLIMHHLPDNKQIHIVVSVLWWIPEPKNNYEKFISDVANAINQIPEKNLRITILPMQVSSPDDMDDMLASKDLLEQINHENKSIFESRDLTDTIELLRSAHLVLGARLHASILSVLNGTPTIGIAYRPKVASFFNDVGLPNYCIDYDKLDALPDMIAQILADYDNRALETFQAATLYSNRRKGYRRLIESL